MNNAALTPNDKLISEFDEDYKNIGLNSVAAGTNTMWRTEQFNLTEKDDAPQLSLLNRFGKPEEVAQASL